MGISSVILRSAVEVAHFGLAESDAEGRFAAVNAVYLAILDLNESDLLGRHWALTVHPDDHQLAQRAHELARIAGAGYVEIRSLRSDAGIPYQALTVESINSEEGLIKGYRCLLRDISSEARGHEALKLAVETAASGLLTIGPGGEIRFANWAVENLFGYTRGELRHCPFKSLFAERQHAQLLDYRVELNRHPANA